MHGKKSEMKTDKEKPKIHLAELFIHHAPGHLGKPEIERADQRKNSAADQHIMKMRHHEEGIVHLKVEWHRGLHHSGETAEDKSKNKTGDKQQRRAYEHAAFPESGDPTKDLHTGGDRDQHARCGEKAFAELGQPDGKHVVHPKFKTEKSGRNQ